jgi:NADH:ubiquinone oxidoreductase subunit 6 (subunit J)
MENIEYVLLIGGQLFCVYRAIVAKRILSATLYLAGVSAITSAILYLLGAYQVAVIELSVGAGLVTVLLVYAVSVVGDDANDPLSIIPKPLAFVLVAAIVILLGCMAYPLTQANETFGTPPDLANVLWQQRVLDVYIQIALLFSGVLGVLGLLSERTLFRKEKALHNPEVSKITVPVEETVR